MTDAFEEFGPYLVYERLGQGGMATVHRAEKRGVGIRRPVALKRLLPHVAADPGLVKLFVDEARLASHLRHANVAQTYELGKVGDMFFIAMEYASGPTLAQIVRQCQRTASELPLAISVNILSQVCEALDYAHNLCDESGRPLRIIHRDVSPANIIVSEGIVKLIDFGIAKATISRVKTQTGLIKGKFGYIAPEYISGKIDARVDLFAVGVVAHEMLAGRRLFEGKDDFETLQNIREMNLRPPSQWSPRVPPDLDDIVMTALQRDPSHRWQSAGAMQVALANVARELGQVIGSQQLASWIDGAFRDDEPSGSSMPELREVTDTDATGPSAPAPDSSLSIEVSRVSSEAIELTPPPEPMPFHERLPSDSDETVPRERVAPGDFELYTPSPAIPPPPPVLPPPAPAPPLPRAAPRPSRAQDAVAPPPAPPPTLPRAAPRPSRAQDAVAPPPVLPRASQPQDAVTSPGTPLVPRPSRPFEATPASPPQDAVTSPGTPLVPRPSRPFEATPASPPLRASRPALPFMAAPPPPAPPPIQPPPRLSHTELAVPPPPPRLSHTELAVPPPPPIQPPRSPRPIDASPPPEPAAPPPPREREPLAPPARSVAAAAAAPESPAPEPPPKQKVRSRAKPTQKTRPQPKADTAEPAASPAADKPAASPAAGKPAVFPAAGKPVASPAAGKPVARALGKAAASPTVHKPAGSPAVDRGAAPRPRRSVVWLILLMVALGAGATAVAYYWPDLF